MALEVHPELDSLHYRRSDKTGPWQPRQSCPMCGSGDVRIGCPYQDCLDCTDVEQSECRACKASWGGADYWATGASTGLAVLDAAGELARVFEGEPRA